MLSLPLPASTTPTAAITALFLLLCFIASFASTCFANPFGRPFTDYTYNQHHQHYDPTTSTFFATTSKMNPSGAPKTHTTRPITTGTSVLGIVFDGGVLLAADTLLSYGSMVKSFNTPRLYSIEDRILLGASGEYSDLQEIKMKVDALALEEKTQSMESLYTDRKLSAKSLWNYLRAVMYQKRSKMNPYWNDVVVAGWDEISGTPFLGVVDKLGTTLQENLVATGFGSYMAMPLMREKYRADLSEGEARALLEDCMKVLFYRDCRASSRIQLAKVTADGCIISDPYELDHSNGWNAPSSKFFVVVWLLFLLLLFTTHIVVVAGPLTLSLLFSYHSAFLFFSLVPFCSGPGRRRLGRRRWMVDGRNQGKTPKWYRKQMWKS